MSLILEPISRIWMN